MTQRVRRIQVRLRTVFTEYCVARAVLFGSVASGTDTEDSDLSLLVDSGLRGLKFVGLVEAIREAVGMPVDVFDVTHIEKGSRIDQEIQATGVTIYKGEDI